MNTLSKLAGFLLPLLAFGAVQANADSIYEVTGTLTVTANSANPGVTETINYSFMLDYIQPGGTAGNYYTGLAFTGTPTITSSGPLGAFSIYQGMNSAGYLEFDTTSTVASVERTQIDLFMNGILPFAPTLTAPVPSVTGAFFYSCASEQACTQFWPDSEGGEAFYLTHTTHSYDWTWGLYGPGTASASVYLVSTPEPGTLCLSVLAALALCLLKKTLTH